jgi:hypothetical protein
LISVVAGNHLGLNPADYDKRHKMLLQSLLVTIQPQYIIGTCSQKSSLETDLALQHKTILMAQVGPPSFYRNDNPYVFGFHVNSDLYPLPAVQTLSFYATQQMGGAAKQPVKVLYRTQSEFFKSTCRSAIDALKASGFTNVTEIEFDPFGDHDSDGNPNHSDIDFLNGLADQACPKKSEKADIHPAIFACTLVEQDILLARWRRNGCRPVALWMTPSVWDWASSNPGVVPYFQGGAQWHESFDYADTYFSSGSELLAYNSAEFGYDGVYDQVVSYSIGTLFAQHIATRYRITDIPTVEEDFTSEEGYEVLRRDLLVMTCDTLFGPFALDEFKRNVGRGGAGTQWLPESTHNATTSWRNKCVSPLPQTEAAVAIPSKASAACDAGLFLSLKLIRSEEPLLSGKCDVCPVDQYTSSPNNELKCEYCPDGSNTEGDDGSRACIIQDANLIPKPIQSMGYAFVGITWFLALHLIFRLIKNNKYDVIRESHISCLMLICAGAMISASSIIALIFAEADVGEDTTAASKACIAIPFIYTTGWVLEYASLAVKAYRLYCDSEESIFVSTRSMFGLVAVALLCDLIVVVAWITQNPLEYTRSMIGTHVDSETGLITMETIGECRNTGGVSVWAYIGPLLVLHASLMIITNMLLWKAHVVEDRYHEQMYVAIASVCVCEVLLIGFPMVLAVIEDGAQRFIVLSIIVFLNDMSILLFIFGPKTNVVATDFYSRAFDGDKMIHKVDDAKSPVSFADQAASISLDSSGKSIFEDDDNVEPTQESSSDAEELKQEECS